ncbi:hypothetical protein ACUXNS_000090 [Brevibacterium pityocampae]
MSSPADGWPHFDPDERTETILHLQARQELAAWEDSGGQDD